MTGGLAYILPLLAVFVIGETDTHAFWDWQLTEPFDYEVDVEVFVLDADAPSAQDIAALKARGVKPVCYISVGTWEEYRDDRDAFPDSIKGKAPGDWLDERYLDIRDHETLLPIMKARIDGCRQKGFTGIEPDNMDLYENETGFPIERTDALNYVRALADYAHETGMEIGQKNAPDLVPDLVDIMDFAIVEECYHYDFCAELKPYADAGKPVMIAEYIDNGVDMDALCARAEAQGFHLIFKETEVAAGNRACR